MGRFSNLEFDDERKRREEETLAAPGEARDEHFYLHLADEHFRGARFENALRFYSRALEFNANLFPAWFGQVQMLVELGEYKEAKIWADKALELHRDHPELLAVKSMACARSGEIDKALQFSDASMAQKGATSCVWLARGEALLAGGKSNHESCFLKADEQAGKDWFLRLSIGRICLLYEEFARGMEWIRKSIEQDARRAFTWHGLGECQAALGMIPQAQISYRQAISLDPEFAPAKAALLRMNNRGFLRRLADSWSGFLARRRQR